jgi:hypothetical protein
MLAFGNSGFHPQRADKIEVNLPMAVFANHRTTLTGKFIVKRHGFSIFLPFTP